MSEETTEFSRVPDMPGYYISSNAPHSGEFMPLHGDDKAVDVFATAMKEKLAAKRAEGYSGWDDEDECSVEYLAELFIGNLPKGDMIDVANFAMMLWHRAGGTGALVDMLKGSPGERAVHKQQLAEAQARIAELDLQLAKAKEDLRHMEQCYLDAKNEIAQLRGDLYREIGSTSS